MKTQNKTDLTSYITGEEKTKRYEFTASEKKRQAEIYLGLVAQGNLMIDYVDELSQLLKKVGMKPNELLLEGYKGLEKFTEALTEVIGSVVDIASNTRISEVQNRIDYTIRREIKHTPKHIKK